MNNKIYQKLFEIKESGGAGLHIFENPKIIFIHQSKCAGTSIYKSLTSTCNEVTNIPLKDVAKNFHQYFSFTIVRNVYTKVLSEYNHEINSKLHNLNFNDWLDKVCKRIRIEGNNGCFADYSNRYNELDQKPFCVIDGRQYLSYVGSFENLHDMLDVFIEKTGLNFNLPKLNPTAYNKTGMTHDQINLIKERFKDDIEYFGF